jgi:sarcosine oxidase subunit beta
VSSADVVVIGAGVMGASVAYHLAMLGVRNVVLVDRGTGPGAGSTGRATGGFRAQYASAINVRLSLRSRTRLTSFRDETGGDAGYQPVGYLFLASSEADVAVLREAQRMQHAEGLHEAAMLGAEEIACLQPDIRLDGVVGAAWCPSYGYIRPMGLLQGFLDAASRQGTLVRWGAELEGFEREGDRLTAVRTSDGRIATGIVVNAAGAWAAQVASLAGISLPVTPVRRQVAITVATDVLPAASPMTIWAGDGFHFRVRDGRVLLLLPEVTIGATPHDTTFDAAWLPRVRALADARVPLLAGVPIDEPGCWCGLYEMSPDHHALLGRMPDLANLYAINGSSGHGVMHAPVLGELLAEMIVHGAARSLDVHALRPERFADGAPNPAPVLL